MKKILFVSGALAILLLPLILTGWAYIDDSIKKAILQGNTQYELSDYMEALTLYERGLEVDSENASLNFNAAQAAYLLEEYEKAIEYYEKSEYSVEKFLNAGNIYFRAGEGTQEEEQKIQAYVQAMQIYQEGIIKFPQNLSLKYNYEFVKSLLESIEEENEEQQNEEGEEQEEQQEESSEEQQEQDSEEQQGEASEESSEEQQEQDSEEQLGEGSEEQQEEDYEESDSYSQEEVEEEIDWDAIERILQILEKQEEQSLKNNQEVIGGSEDKYGW